MKILGWPAQVPSLVLHLVSTICPISLLISGFSPEVLSVGVSTTGVCLSLGVRPCQVGSWGDQECPGRPCTHLSVCVCSSNRSGAAALCRHQRDWCLWSGCLIPAPWKDPPHHAFMDIPYCWSSVLLPLWGHWCCLCVCGAPWGSRVSLCLFRINVRVYALACREYRSFLLLGARSCVSLTSARLKHPA